MTKRGEGVLLHGEHEPKIVGYLVIGGEHYEVIGRKVSEVRTDLKVWKNDVGATEAQGDLFDEHDQHSGQSGERKCDLV